MSLESSTWSVVSLVYLDLIEVKCILSVEARKKLAMIFL